MAAPAVTAAVTGDMGRRGRQPGYRATPCGCSWSARRAGKTEVVRSTSGLPETFEVSTVTESGLLSGTSSRERAEDATGGLLRQIGAMGTIVLGDFTSVLSMDRDGLARVLAALREIYDGRWQRTIGADGGRTLEWEGKVGLVGGVTNAIDRHHSVIGRMGERLLLYRLRVADLRVVASGALGTVGHEEQMRKELAAATAGVFAAAPDHYQPPQLTPDEEAQLISVGILVAKGRASVLRYGSRIEVTVDPEVPTRLARQLLTLARGMESIGVPWPEAWACTMAVALGCIPDLRVRALLHLFGTAEPKTEAVAGALRRPRVLGDRPRVGRRPGRAPARRPERRTCVGVTYCGGEGDSLRVGRRRLRTGNPRPPHTNGHRRTTTACRTRRTNGHGAERERPAGYTASRASRSAVHDRPGVQIPRAPRRRLGNARRHPLGLRHVPPDARVTRRRRHPPQRVGAPHEHHVSPRPRGTRSRA